MAKNDEIKKENPGNIIGAVVFFGWVVASLIYKIFVTNPSAVPSFVRTLLG
jgi:hypothetical protein